MVEPVETPAEIFRAQVAVIHLEYLDRWIAPRDKFAKAHAGRLIAGRGL